MRPPAVEKRGLGWRRCDMKRKYPEKMFWLFVLANFLFHFIYLFVPGVILCLIGIRVKLCLWIGVFILGVDFILSVVEQVNIRKAAEEHSDNPRFNELMDAFCGSGGLKDFGRVLEGKEKPSDQNEHQEEN